MLVLQKELAALVKKLSLFAKHHVQLAEVRINYQWLLISLIFGSFQRYISSWFSLSLLTTYFAGNASCSDWQFLCAKENKCIPSRWRCDYVSDCDDGTDEQNCTR